MIEPDKMISIDSMITYGGCLACGAEEGEQCSTEQGEELAGWVHELRLVADCPSCDGNGWENGNGFSATGSCADCGGTGKVPFTVEATS